VDASGVDRLGGYTKVSEKKSWQTNFFHMQEPCLEARDQGWGGHVGSSLSDIKKKKERKKKGEMIAWGKKP